jgi:hypothetical protein
MIRSVLCSLLLLLGDRCEAQDDLVFIIDTVVTPSDGFPISPLLPEGSTWMSMAFDTTDRITTYNVEWNEQPNVLLHIPNGRRDGGVRLDLDDEGGELTLRWPTTYDRDTIRISRYEVFDRCIRDTINTQVEYFNVTDTGLTFIEVKHKRSLGPKPKCRKKRSHISLTINDAVYVVPITIIRSSQSTVSLYHGYIPQHCDAQNDGIRDQEKACKYFHGRELWLRWCYSGEVMLK